MNKKATNIHPVFDNNLNREDKELLLNQRSKVIWITGLSGSGKSTIASVFERALHEKGFISKLLDGDNVRTGINNNLGFSEDDRTENIRRVAEISKLFIHCGVVLINCFISPLESIRNKVKEIVGEDDFLVVYINTPLEVCESRDPKGLYKKARAGEIKNFTGIDSPFEEPKNPFIEINTEVTSVEESVDLMLKKILPLIEYKEKK